jgi:hypothetical protein
MSDELRAVFEEFETLSLAHTVPPGTAAVKRTVRRRYATRAALLAVAAGLALLLVWLPVGASHPQPIQQSPTPTPGSSASPDTAPSGSGAAAAAGSASPTTTPPTPECDPNNPAYEGFRLGQPAPDQYELTPGMLAGCPSLRIWLTQATYVGAGANAATVTRTASTAVTLSAANPSVSLPPNLPAPSCASVVVVTYLSYTGPPATLASMPNPVPQLVASGNTADLAYYLAQQGRNLRAASWQAPTC